MGYNARPGCVELAGEEGGESIILVKINEELCDGCGTCVEQCPNQVFVVVDQKSQAQNSKDCMACYLCETACPKLAIKITE
jgi:NAD-dependent dihydropyrimidine dehydrogenase PreA subunit